MRSVGLITMHKYMVTSQQSLIREDGEMHITLQKREKGKTWSSPIQGQGSLDPYAADQEQNGLFCKGFKKRLHSLVMCGIQDLTSPRLSSLEPALTQEPLWVEFALTEAWPNVMYLAECCCYPQSGLPNNQMWWLYIFCICKL